MFEYTAAERLKRGESTATPLMPLVSARVCRESLSTERDNVCVCFRPRQVKGTAVGIGGGEKHELQSVMIFTNSSLLNTLTTTNWRRSGPAGSRERTEILQAHLIAT